MSKEESHISDEELLRIADGELHGHRAAVVRDHLAACWQCRTRQSQIELTIGEFMDFHRETHELPPAGRPQRQLEERLAERAALLRTSYWERSLPIIWMIRRHAYAGVALLVLILVGGTIHYLLPDIQAGAVPNARLTPGAIRTVAREDICSTADAGGHLPVPDRVAFRVFDKYGIHDPQPRTFEVDYLITPALGGSDDMRNLWPEPYAEGVWNAHVKDALEDRLHELVCSGQLELATAQHDIATNWIEAYKKYFHADKPFELHAEFSKDPPWE